MASRRMFSLKVIDTDFFLEMPVTSQCLYFHLSMRADDDGFVSSPKKILKMIGSNDDDLRILISKKFIIPFESGICVIKHWRIHNYIQNDRHHPTIYKDELSQLNTDENGSYESKCIQNVSRMDTEVRLGKVRIEKDICASDPKAVDARDFEEFWNLYPRKKNRKGTAKIWAKQKLWEKKAEIIANLTRQVHEEWRGKDLQYIPHPTTYLNQERWLDPPEVRTKRIDLYKLNEEIVRKRKEREALDAN